MSLARRTFSSLAIPAYRRYFVGNVASLLGFWMRLIVQGWLVYELTDSKAMLGVVTAVGLIPFAIVSPFGGVLGDRLDRRLLLATAPLVSVSANIVLGILTLTGLVEIWHVMVTAGAIGVARAVEIPVRNAFVRDVVGLDELQNAVALNAGGFNVARVTGPALAGVGMATIGMGSCFFIAAVLNAAMTVAMVGLRVGPAPTGGAHGHPIRQLIEGLRYVHGHRRTRTVLGLLAIALVFTWSYQTLLPAFAPERLGLGQVGYALLATLIGMGGLGGALWVAGLRTVGSGRRNIVFGALWAGAIAVFALGFVRRPLLAAPFLVIAGFCQVAFIATANGMVQETVPDALRARVMGLFSFTFGASFPLGSMFMGGVSQTFGFREAWGGGALLMLVLSVGIRLRLPSASVAEAELAADHEARARVGAAESPGVAGPPA